MNGIDAPSRERAHQGDSSGASGSGWDDAALALHSVQRIAAPMVVSLRPENYPAFYIDIYRREFYSRANLADFPVDPGHVTVETQVAPAEPSVSARSDARNLDNLLWVIGQAGFSGAPAPWLASGARYRISRWPNFTELDHTFDHMRMTARLSSVPLTVAELAAEFNLGVRDVQRTINAYSLLGILIQSVDSTASYPARTSRALPTGGLLSRLRSRWGL